jgi:hypothetical protein
MQLPHLDLANPDDVFGLSILAFFVLAVVAFFFIAYKFMTVQGEKVKRGERVMMWSALVGVVLVLGYAVLAFLFKIII